MRLSPLPLTLIRWFGKHARDLPWRRTSDPYAIWISEIMLQQTQVKTVIPYFERWMEIFPKVESLAGAPEQRVLKMWEGLGYYTRARNLQKAARVICENHCGQFPAEFEQVLALPGIGRYTAGAICSIAFNQPAAIVDGNVARVLARFHGMTGDIKANPTREKLWSASEALVRSTSDPATLNQSLIELGALICTPRQPLCGACPIQKSCHAFQHNQTAELPEILERKPPHQRLFLAFVLRHRGRFLVRQRATGQVNGGLWEFPNFEPAHKRNFRKEIPLQLGFVPQALLPFLALKHSITTSRITLRSFRAELNGESKQAAANLRAVWKTPSQMRALPFASAHGKIRSALLEIL